jgi:hypothetical protein
LLAFVISSCTRRSYSLRLTCSQRVWVRCEAGTPRLALAVALARRTAAAAKLGMAAAGHARQKKGGGPCSPA